MMKHILRIVVGWIVVFIVLSRMIANSIPLSGLQQFLELVPRTGIISDTLGMIVLSIVCTAGFSLIVWIPLWYGVGWIVLDVVFEVVGWGRKALGIEPVEDAKQLESESAVSLPREQQALLSYIKKARTKGLNDTQITLNLSNNGWTTDDITAAFQMARMQSIVAS